jgi:hypothetical protein
VRRNPPCEPPYPLPCCIYLCTNGAAASDISPPYVYVLAAFDQWTGATSCLQSQALSWLLRTQRCTRFLNASLFSRHSFCSKGNVPHTAGVTRCPCKSIQQTPALYTTRTQETAPLHKNRIGPNRPRVDGWVLILICPIAANTEQRVANHKPHASPWHAAMSRHGTRGQPPASHPMQARVVQRCLKCCLLTSNQLIIHATCLHQRPASQSANRARRA